MNSNVVVELIKILPSLIWASLATVLIALMYKPIRYELIPRMTGLKAFGVEATFNLVKKELEQAAENLPVGTEADRNQVARRAQRIASVIKGARVLLVNDIPSEMRHVITILQSLELIVDVAISTTEALSLMDKTLYDVVISDMRRG